MEEFVSVFDLTNSDDATAKKAVRDEVATIQFTVRRAMDQGLSPEEMKVAEKLRDAAKAASEVLDDLL